MGETNNRTQSDERKANMPTSRFENKFPLFATSDWQVNRNHAREASLKRICKAQSTIVSFATITTASVSRTEGGYVKGSRGTELVVAKGDPADRARHLRTAKNN